MADSGRTAVFTVASKNYVHFARTLMGTLAAQQPGWERFVLLADRVDGHFDPRQEPWTLVTIDDLPIPEPRKFQFRYSILELNTAAKPWFFRWLFDQGFERVVYLDPDIFVYAPLREVERAWSEGALAVLTPHLTGRIRDRRAPGERAFLVAGTYNLGFLALARRPDLDALLEYWCEKSLVHFAADVRDGLFTDQKWMDLVPGMFSDVVILRHAGFNVAYWNLPHRRVERVGDRLLVNGVPLVFFHFSGLDPACPDGFSRHQNRYRLADLGPVADLVRDYVEAVRANGFEECRGWPYAFGQLADGSPLPAFLRKYYRESADFQRFAGKDPFALDDRALTRSSDGRTPPVTWVMRALRHANPNPNLRHAFPAPLGADREAFARWFVTSAWEQHRIPARWVEPVRQAHAPLPDSPVAPRDPTRSSRPGRKAPFATLPEALQAHAGEAGDRLAIRFLGDGETETSTWTYAALEARARAIAARLVARHFDGERALLLHASGPELVAAFFGCLSARVVPVLSPRPRPGRARAASERFARLRADARPALALFGDPADAGLVRDAVPGLDALDTSTVPDDAGLGFRPPPVASDRLAFLQYTSGSTSDPRGVCITHANLATNLEAIGRVLDRAPELHVFSWLPPHHDMGLVGGILAPLFRGGVLTLMDAGHFLQRPARWLDAISRWRASGTGAPSTAYDLCARTLTTEKVAGLDLSPLEVAFVGAETVRPDVLARFEERFARHGLRRGALYPCYGLAEATLVVTGGRPGDGWKTFDRGRPVVGLGGPVADTRVRIVDPVTRVPLPEGEEGEIWVTGPGVAAGYWAREATADPFGARLSHDGGGADDESSYLRTGDLGALLGGELVVTGRRSDVMIFAGVNVHPVDVEATVRSAHPDLEPEGIAAWPATRARRW